MVRSLKTLSGCLMLHAEILTQNRYSLNWIFQVKPVFAVLLRIEKCVLD